MIPVVQGASRGAQEGYPYHQSSLQTFDHHQLPRLPDDGGYHGDHPMKSSDTMTNAQVRLFHVCEFAFTTTTGAFVGLLGGRAASPDANNLAAGVVAATEPKKTAPRPRREAKAGALDDPEDSIESKEE